MSLGLVGKKLNGSKYGETRYRKQVKDCCSGQILLNDTPAGALGPEAKRKTRGNVTIVCHNCGRTAVHRSRNLCRSCYNRPEVRARFGARPTPQAGDWRTQPSDYNRLPLPPKPTDALPGSAEKMLVMTDRLSRGYHLHHPLDARLTLS